MADDVNLVVAHPDKDVRASLIKTLQPLWRGKVTDACEADDVQTLRLSLMPTSSPPRLQDMLWQLRQRAQSLRWPKEIHIGEARLETTTRLFHANGCATELTEKEVAMLMHLYRTKAPVTRAELLRDVWRYASDAETHTVETHIHRLRQKIEADPEKPIFLLTVKEGYTLGN